MSDKEMIHIRSIGQIHEIFGVGRPKHPHITILDAADVEITSNMIGTKFVSELYYIAIKSKDCGLEYGRNHYDFEEGALIFTAPNQVVSVTEEQKLGENSGWMLFFHPDLIRKSSLGQNIDEYSYFNYETHEALHLSEDEENVLLDCLQMIKGEYEQRIDTYSQRVIASTLELMLNYCMRFYERQFNTRSSSHKDVVSKFESLLKAYFNSNLHVELGIPSIKYFADKVFLSPHYLSDLLKKETDRSAKDHINDFIIEQAKNSLLVSDQSISEIAYELGFNYPHYFTRLFKAKTGSTPNEFRKLS